MLVALVLLLGVADGAADRMLAAHRGLTTVATRCPDNPVPGEVLVCGRRRADRHRLPLAVVPDSGDPRTVDVPAEKARLVAKRDNCREKSAFLIGCGMAGVSMTTDGRGTRVQAARPLSP